MSKEKQSNFAKRSLPASGGLDKEKSKSSTFSKSAEKKKSLDQNETNEEADPICEKCGNVKIREPLDGTRDKKTGEWVCPHCQGEIDFFGDDEE